MAQYLLISGSPRAGNTEFLLKRIYEGIAGDKELILLREKEIKHCLGCSVCHRTYRCVIDDDMKDILRKMKECKVMVIGTPNYFDNVSGILKDFIDRTHPCYKQESLAGKRLVLIMTGGEKVEGIKKYLASTTFGFVKYLKLDLLGNFCFQADKADDLSNDEGASEEIDRVIRIINEIDITEDAKTKK